MKTFLQLSLVILGLLALPPFSRAEPALLGHSAFGAQTLDADGIKAVLLGKRVTIDGTRIVIVIAKTSEAQDRFLQNAVGMTTGQFRNYWRRLFMTGGGSAPKIVENENEACKTVAATAGAITIADAGQAAGLAVLAR